jgi:putative transposase
MRSHYPRHLPGFTYVGPHRYFLTFCCADRRDTFTDVAVVDLVMAQFQRAGCDESIAIVAACFMPDHVHLVVEGAREDADLKRFISRGKQLSGFYFKQAYKKTLWQRYGYERVLREEESTRRVVAYVLENPVRAGLAKTVHDYPLVRSSLYGREALIEYAYQPGPAEAGCHD